jgi:hypothetical protein
LAWVGSQAQATRLDMPVVPLPRPGECGKFRHLGARGARRALVGSGSAATGRPRPVDRPGSGSPSLSNGFAWASDPDRLQGICIFGSAAIRVFVQRWWGEPGRPTSPSGRHPGRPRPPSTGLATESSGSVVTLWPAGDGGETYHACHGVGFVARFGTPLGDSHDTGFDEVQPGK